MGVEKVLKNRRSVRGFLPDPVPEEMLKHIFGSAIQSPSNCNTQPWNVYVVSGDALERLRQRLYRLVSNGAPQDPDFGFFRAYAGKHRERQIGAARALYGAMAIERHDSEGRQDAMLRNWLFFGAPHAAFFTMEKYLGLLGAVDLGIFAQSVTLLMAEYGIDCCMQGALNRYTSVIREECGIPEDYGIVFGMSFGYVDPKAPANNARTTRVPLDGVVSFIG